MLPVHDRTRAVRLATSTIEQGSKNLICISFTKLNIHLLLERVFLNFSGYSLTATQIQANATKRLRQLRLISSIHRYTSFLPSVGNK
ncbi:hypothetical protein CSKR_106736 [Clonorchis sinensis]|uniref:Uncharacterized protein n=1 Tax=Clonorchis sinensis TaxID=79923 RepID=A0A419Q8B5_CLOSI|nr:hypothetical protein CSKR_106736 [Clonorchis sinensis]